MIINEEDFTGFVSGNNQCFNNIFYQYYKTLVSFAMRYDISSHEAEDVVLETFQYIWQSKSKIVAAAALNSLLFTTVKNKSLNITRNNSKRKLIINERIEKIESEEFRDYIMEEEITTILNNAINILSEQSRTVVLSLLAGKNIQEIAESMNLSVNSVKTYRLRAVAQLRRILGNRPMVFLWLVSKLF